MAANGIGSLMFIDNVYADKAIRMTTELLRAILSTHIQLNTAKIYITDDL